MKDGRIVVARLWHRYRGEIPSRAPIILGINPQKYQTICIYLMKNSNGPNYFEEKGCKVFYMSRKKFLRIFNLLIVWKLSMVLRRENVDIIHCHGHQATIYGTIAAKIASVPVIIAHVHGSNRTKNFRRRFSTFIVLRWVNKILTLCEVMTREYILENPVVRPEQVVTLGNSIGYDQYSRASFTKAQAKENIGLRSDSFIFGTVARMAPAKGQSYLIKAFREVKQVLPSAHLVIVGDGRLRSQLEAQAAKTAPGSIHLLGHRSDVPELLRAMDVFVFPSVVEPFGRALTEAMAAGVPCIASDVGGIPEILANGEFGFLVPPRDEGALAEAMIKLSKTPGPELKQLIEKAKQRVRQRYNHGKIIEKLQSLYEVAYAESQRNHSDL